MTDLPRWLCLLLLSASPLFCEDGSKQLLSNAEELFAATLYQEAIPLYQQIHEPDLQPLVLCRLGQAHYYAGRYEEALSCLEKADGAALSPADGEEKAFTAALCYRRLERPKEAAALLSSYPFKKYRDEAAYELGLAHFLLGNGQDAAVQFESLAGASHKPAIYTLSRLYLARLALSSHDHNGAMKILNAVEEPSQEALQKELAFLKGEAAFQSQDYSKAVSFFEAALPAGGEASVPWESETLYSLGWSYVKLAEREQDAVRKDDRLKKAEQTFGRLHAGREDERYVIALAHAHLTRAALLKDAEASKKAESLLADFNAYTTEEARAEALLMRAEAAGSYAGREAIYKELTAESNAGSPCYAKGWYLRAVNDYEEAERQGSEQLFAKAAGSFAKARDLLSDAQDPRASQCLRYRAQALWNAASPESKIEALHVLQKALEGNPDDDDLDALYGAYAIYVVREDVPEKELNRIETTLKQRGLIRKSPSPTLSLAAFYFKRSQYDAAQKVYLEFAEAFPDSELAPHALLQASLAAENGSAGQEAARALRKRVYEQHPASEVAPQAYFLMYSLQDYLQGDRAALKHLAAFKERFPHSPLLIHAHYLIGLDLKRDRRTLEGKWIRKKSPTQSVQAFLDVEATFDRLLAEGAIPDDVLDYYIQLRYRAALERALVFYEVAEESNAAKRDIFLQYAIDALEPLKADLEQTNHPLTGRLATEGGFCPLHEECLYWLSLSYLRSGRGEAAHHVIGSMLDRYQGANINSGYYLSRIRYEQGVAALNFGDAEAALAFFLKAEEASRGKFLGIDEKLDLWICQSECYKALGQNESAMLVLSKVINDDAASHLRLKAMFLRASLYEKLERPDLARRQLESVAKMGGEWAVQAKIKLDQDYANP